MGDLGETANSTATVAGLVGAQPDVLISLGDNSCERGAMRVGWRGQGQPAGGDCSNPTSHPAAADANDHKSNDAGDGKSGGGDLNSYQP